MGALEGRGKDSCRAPCGVIGGGVGAVEEIVRPTPASSPQASPRGSHDPSPKLSPRGLPSQLRFFGGRAPPPPAHRRPRAPCR